MGLSVRRLAVAAVPVAAIVAAAALLATGGASGTNKAATAGGGGWPPTAIERLTHLTALPAKAAPPFTLTDQRGRRVSLASLRGKVVVMQPMDPECTDICPVVAQELIDAAHDLGPRASRVVFLGLNVNRDHEGIAAVNAFSHKHRLDRMARWHFLTGSTATLKRLWREYLITVEINRAGEVTHSSEMYFIDPQSRWRWVALPQVEKLAIPQWGAAIAKVAEHLMGSAS